jgi:DNA-binding transcriptional LysR family regulator
VEDRVDVGFRLGISPAEGVVARRLFPLQLIVCGAPSYLAQHGAPDSIETLAGHRCSAFRNPATGRIVPWYLKVDDSLVEVPVAPALCLNDEGIETEAVLAGHVIGLLSGVAAAPHIRAGRLVPLLTQHIADRSSVFVYYGSRAAQPTRVRAFIDLAVERLSNNPAYVLTAEELRSAQARGLEATRNPAAR